MAQGQLQEALGRQHECLLPATGEDHTDGVEAGLQTLGGS